MQKYLSRFSIFYELNFSAFTDDSAATGMLDENTDAAIEFEPAFNVIL